jgi:hypothetical protein
LLPPFSYSWAGNPSIYSFGYPPTSTTTSSANWQRLVLPDSGRYTITAAGSSNGKYLSAPNNGYCRGAIISTNVTLPFGTALYVMIGQTSAGCSPPHYPSGGGTFVLSDNGTALVVAGGGGGHWNTETLYSGCDASLTSTSGNPSSSGEAGGVNGGPGQNSNSVGSGMAGAGLVGSTTGSTSLWQATSALDGGFSSNCAPSDCGGLGWCSFPAGGRHGGGGGYSGGGAPSPGNVGGGGGSFCVSGLANCAARYNAASQGWVTLTYLGK